MAHATRTPYLHIQRLVIAFHCFPYRVSEVEAAATRWCWIQDNIDRKGNNLARPRIAAAENQRQRHSAPMVHVHLVDDGEIEIVLNDRLGNMRSKFRMTDQAGYGPRPPTFISN